MYPTAKRVHLDDLCWVDTFRLPETRRLPDGGFQKLWDSRPGERGVVKMRGKETPVKRWMCSYGPGYRFSGVDHPGTPFRGVVKEYLDWVRETPYESETPGTYNECFVNWYGDGKDYIGAHADDVTLMVEHTPVVCISFGAERKFRVRRRPPPTAGPTWPIALDFPIDDGLVYVMGGRMQERVKIGKSILPRYKHESPPIGGRKGAAVGKRISLTFRKFRAE